MDAHNGRYTPPMPGGADMQVMAAEHSRMQALLAEMYEVNRASDVITERMLTMVADLLRLLEQN